ncbi:mitochondrial carrier [Hesseltinella vesiculosa]|uniref:Mitochondrial carrier n=1 Tax=Hesseltinella vesiculosa TaxID=101127 RepID=A0A1X2GU86_9FUNG|nr:mitochondrial carrier [Hesseltinella vesiculosa]
MTTDSSHPYATFPTTPGKGMHGLRPYFTPGVNNNFNYTSIATPADVYYPPPPSDDYNDLIDSRAAARELINFSVLKFLTTAVSNPFEVSKTLMQVQYTPHEDVEVLSPANSTPDDQDTDYKEYDELSSEEDDDDGDFYAGSHSRRRFSDDIPAAASMDVDDPMFRQQKVTLDQSGYVMRTSVYDDATRPAYQIKPIDKGVWQGIGRLLKQPHEGWRSLFKGQYTNWLYEICHLFLQPTVEGSLNDAFGLYDDTIPLVHLDHIGPNLATLVASHVFVGIILSPLELIRTRLIVQSASPLHRKYKGPLHALRTILEEEGGFRGLYLNHNLLPTVLYHALTPLLQNITPIFIDRVLKINASDSPFVYGLAELSLNTLELLIMLPLETIRKRLQCQIRSRTSKKRFETVVALRPVPYTGIADAAYHIIKEEGGRRRRDKQQTDVAPKVFFTGWGWRGLYQGFSMQCTSNIILFVLHAVNGIEEDYDDF